MTSSLFPKIGFLCVLLFFEFCSGLRCSSNPFIKSEQPLVLTDSGYVAGKYTKVFNTKVAEFLGIPFAEPPIGEKRFRKPTPIEPWEGIRQATKKPPLCMQYYKNVGTMLEDEPSENCLFLNVWVPSECCCDVYAEIPVLVWIYEGRYYSGSTENGIYNGSILASLGNTIVVTMNYRVGSFGFLYTGQKDALGNAALYDQNLAFKWIRENIPHFGGDASNITLFGQSSEAWYISYHMMSPLSQNLFQRAIMQSETSYHPLIADSIHAAIYKTNELADIAGCRNNGDLNFTRVVQCLKRKEGVELSKADHLILLRNPLHFLPTVDHEFLLTSPIEAFQSGNFQQKKVLIGNVANESTTLLVNLLTQIFDPNRKLDVSLEDSKNILQELFETVPFPSVSAIHEQYFNDISNDNDEEIVRAISNLISDYLFNCPGLFLDETLWDTHVNWYSYHSVHDPTAPWIGVTYYADISYVLGVPTHNTNKYTVEDAKFSKELIRKWITFSQKGGAYLPESIWPRYTESEPWILELNPKKHQKMMHPRNLACEFWRPYFF